MRTKPYRSEDLESLRNICLLTGANGGDASGACTHPDLLGDYFAIPYVVRDPSLCLVLADEHGNCGYILGTADTRAFNTWFNSSWLPEIRSRYHDLKASPDASDDWLLARLGEDVKTPTWVDEYPAHLHIDLLPRAQGGGWGRKIFVRWLQLAFDRGASGVHLGVSKANTNAVGFYENMGMTKIEEVGSTLMMGLKNPRAGG